jgi:hypothetical protein
MAEQNETARFMIERFAIRAAKGNNGGEWATHYTEDQKQHWRDFVRDMMVEMIICDARLEGRSNG